MNYKTNSTHKLVYQINCWSTVEYIPLYDPYINFVYLAISFLSSIIPPIIFLNGIIIYILWSTQSLHTPANTLIGVTAACDVLSALISMTSTVAVWFLVLSHHIDCTLYISTVYTSHVFSFLSFLLVCLMAFDRYVAIFKPYFYCRRISISQTVYTPYIAVITFLVLLLNGLNFLTSNKHLIQIAFLIFIPTLSLFYICVQVKVQRIVKDIARPVNGRRTSVGSELPSGIAKANQEIASSKKTMQAHIRISYLTMLIVLSICICYTPYNVFLLIQFIPSKYQDDDWLRIGYILSYSFMCLKSLLNPLIYCYRSSTIRKKIRHLLTKSDLV
ncbi:olfactory receptor 51B5-like [Hydractinia symbiolongicarpus]|uniref:olfactory receptor 51B5-like n=1 Tax=Hydractinia symbiolongicarpus TaxID=13093 RepID=UPI00254ED283|nr:olfactory receptor 51B5-like [Hydractinia symbiolongicarpus]